MCPRHAHLHRRLRLEHQPQRIIMDERTTKKKKKTLCCSRMVSVIVASLTGDGSVCCHVFLKIESVSIKANERGGRSTPERPRGGGVTTRWTDAGFTQNDPTVHSWMFGSFRPLPHPPARDTSKCVFDQSKSSRILFPHAKNPFIFEEKILPQHKSGPPPLPSVALPHKGLLSAASSSSPPLKVHTALLFLFFFLFSFPCPSSGSKRLFFFFFPQPEVSSYNRSLPAG